MSTNWPKPGAGHVASYAVPGIPWVTSSASEEVLPAGQTVARSPIKISFPYATKGFTIKNTGISDLRVGFSERGIFAPCEMLPDGTRKSSDENSHRNYFIIYSTGSSAIPVYVTTDSATSITTRALGSSASRVNYFYFDIRCKEIFLLADGNLGNIPSSATQRGFDSPAKEDKTSFTILAELTTIASSEFPSLTGSISGKDTLLSIKNSISTDGKSSVG